MINSNKISILLFCFFIDSTWVLPVHGYRENFGGLNPINPNLLAFISWDASIKVWNLDQDRVECNLSEENATHASPSSVNVISWHPKKSNLIASGSILGYVRVWDIITQQCICELSEHADSISSVAWHPKNPNRLASGSLDKTVKIWNIKKGKCTCTFIGHTNAVSSVSWNPLEPNLIASGSLDGTIKIWDIATQKCLFTLESWSHGLREPINSVSWHPLKPGLLASGGEDSIKLWDVSSQKCLCTKNAKHTFCISWHPMQSDVIASVPLDPKYLKIWNMTTQRLPYSMVQVEGYPSDSISWSSNGRCVVFTAHDVSGCFVKIWDINDTLQVFTFEEKRHSLVDTN